jgi:crossover junction endodeoxyribonuclease RusA
MKELQPSEGLFIELEEVPPTVNTIWRHRVIGKFASVYLTQKGKQFKERLAEKVPKDLIPTEKECKVHINLTFPDKRKRDIDNYSKGILDAFNKKIYKDDSQIIELHIVKNYEKNKPNIFITVEVI